MTRRGLLTVLGSPRILAMILLFSFIAPGPYDCVCQEVAKWDTGGSGRSGVHLRFSFTRIVERTAACGKQGFQGFQGVLRLIFAFLSFACFISSLFLACLGEHSIVCVARREKGLVVILSEAKNLAIQMRRKTEILLPRTGDQNDTRT